jgi:hypothetical protein
MKKNALILLSLFIMLLYGCGVPFQKKLDVYLMNGDYQLADQLIDTEKAKGYQYNDKNELLYYFDKGSVTQMLGEYKLSSDFLTKADDMIDALYTRSAGDEVNSFLSNDLSLKYTGEDFEQVMVNILNALNYMYAGDFSSARVEVKKVNNKLNLFADKYGDKAIYTDDAFARYLSAFCYEVNGDVNDAYIDYKKSYEQYQKYSVLYGVAVPETIKQDLLRTAGELNFTEDVDNYKKEFGDTVFTPANELKKEGEIMVVVYDGMPAYKVEGYGHMPMFTVRGYAVSSMEVSAQGVTGRPFVAQDLSVMAVKNLETKNGLILLKSVGRDIVKSLVKQIPFGSLFVSEDKADTRSWRTIPARFQVVRMAVPTGNVKALVKLTSVSGIEKVLPFEFNLKAGQKKVIPVFSLN